MSLNQQHGKQFETKVLSTLPLTSTPASNAVFDVPMGILGALKAGSIKMFKAGTRVHLSDARRMWSWSSILKKEHGLEIDTKPELVLICGEFEQKGDIKVITKIYEFEIKDTPEAANCLYGGISFEEVSEFHKRIGLNYFPEGHHTTGRKFAREYNKELSKKKGIIKLNGKIGSDKQRRIQCTVSLKDLISNADTLGSMKVFDTEYRGMSLPIQITSSERTFNEKC